ncbi:MAG: AAA family ATPase [Desulfobulbaceae bacterium]|nr:AAA family ATPase [Desulfobulbaceae bacterium]
MRYIADLHIHSLYSRATSKASHLHGLAAWAAIKGINVLGTGDFTHPAWFAHLQEHLEEAEPGFFALKSDGNIDIRSLVPEGVTPDIEKIRFVLTSEISSIYKRGGKVRKVHNLLFAPDFAAVRKISTTLAGIGNIESDGRPILGLDSQYLLEILLESTSEGFFIPAHIWTPWFSLFGSKSGFDTIEECFGDLSSHIFALETGLSSDPEMNRHVSALDRFTFISNSDCHSPGKLGREANIFDTGFDFFSMREAIRSPVDAGGNQVFASTIEFYPEEGKYHCDGHRKCGVCMEPAQTVAHQGICPVCGKPMTIGVLNRVMELADRKKSEYPTGSPAVHSLTPLPELLSELLGVGPASKKVMTAYAKLINTFGSEFNLLLNTGIEDIAQNSSTLLGEAIKRIREGRVIRQPGFDGEFGVIRVFAPEERNHLAGQLNLFGIPPAHPRKKRPVRKSVVRAGIKKKQSPVSRKKRLNPEQQAAIDSNARNIIVKAGPGTGKTHTLVQKVVRIFKQDGSPCTVITFTNKAADEVQQRLDEALGKNHDVFVATFHGYCLHLLRKNDARLRVVGPEMRHWILRRLFSDANNPEMVRLKRRISDFLAGVPGSKNDDLSRERNYFTFLDCRHLIDIEAVIPCTVHLLKQGGDVVDQIREQTGHLFVDEFQDLNHGQFDLVQLLADTSSVFAIGDPDQAIYGFRGSDPGWFFRYIEELHPEQHVLVKNYRNAPDILTAAEQVIAHNSTWSENPPAQARRSPKGVIYLHKLSSADAEAHFVASQIEQLLGGTSHREIDRLVDREQGALSLGDISVLARTAKQTEAVARELSGRGIPFQLVDLKPFYESEPTRLLYLWSRLAAGEGDAVQLLDLLGREKGVGQKSLQTVEQLLPAGCDNALEILARKSRQINSRAIRGILDQFQSLCRQIRFRAESFSLVSALELVLQRYTLDKEHTDIRRFLHLAGTFGTSITDFSRHLQRYRNSVVYDERAEAVTLMTLHAAKGLEFSVVFMVGLEEDLMPLKPRGQLTDEELLCHIEEERRLFFVGMTRAADILYLTYATSRTIYGKQEDRRPSRFIGEIKASLLEQPGLSTSMKKKKKVIGKQLSLF